MKKKKKIKKVGLIFFFTQNNIKLSITSYKILTLHIIYNVG